MTTNCPLCGRHMGPLDSPEDRAEIGGVSLPICKECAGKRKWVKV